MNNLDNVKQLDISAASYIAGFLDADGSIHLQIKRRNKEGNRHNYHFHPVVNFANNRVKVLDWIQSNCGRFGNLKKKYKNHVKDRSHTLTFSSSVIRWLLPQLEPYLILKREQARLMIEYTRMTREVRGGKIKSDLWLKNMKKYLEIYERIRCLNHDIEYAMVFKKVGELLEDPKSLECYNVIGDNERERYKKFKDWIISSQAYRKCNEYLRRYEGSETRD